jgi:hypothetical protein
MWGLKRGLSRLYQYGRWGRGVPLQLILVQEPCSSGRDGRGFAFGSDVFV